MFLDKYSAEIVANKIQLDMPKTNKDRTLSSFKLTNIKKYLQNVYI